MEIEPERKLSSPDTAQKKSETNKLLPVRDTLTIYTKSAVFFQPDSLHMEKRMKEAGEGNFRAGADDYIYYMNISVEYLEHQSLTIIDAKDKKYLKFLMTDNKVQLVELDKLEDLWGVYFFDPNKKPHYADLVELENEYKEYFK